MRDSKVCNAKRITAGVIGLMMLIIVLFSAFYIAAEANHRCADKNCSVCSCILMCETILHKTGGRAAFAAVIIPVLYTLFSIFLSAPVFLQETLIARKVRLNN